MKLPQLSLQLGNLRIFDVICSQKTCVKKRGNLLGKSEETYKEKARKPARKKRGNLLGKSEETYKEKARKHTRKKRGNLLGKSEETCSEKARKHTLKKQTSLLGQKAKKHTLSFGRSISGGVSGIVVLFRRHFRAASLRILSLSRVKFMPQKFSYKFPLGLIKKLGLLSYYLFPSVVKYI
jgi:hypothetical protein